MLKKILLISTLVIAVAIAAFAAGQKAGKGGAKAGNVGMPTSVLHVITLRWKADATEEQKKAVLDGVKKMADQVPGIKNIWVKTIKVQGGTQDSPYNAIIAMEFVDEAALKAYSSHPAHDEWYKIYLPIRDESRTHDVSNDAPAKK